MANNKEEQKIGPVRRKLVVSFGILSVLGLLTGAIGIPGFRKRKAVDCAPSGKDNTVRMLTQDGRLVEIDKTLLKPGGKKISEDELKSWVKR